MVIRIGVTGGIATGKSTVGKLLEDLCVPVLDADAVVHALLATDDSLRQKILGAFGADVFLPNGQVNRSALGAIVFQDAVKRRLLESWIHPQVRVAIDRFFEQHGEKAYAAALVPLIYESDLVSHFDAVWVVYATPQQQLERLMQFRHLSQAQAQERIASQMSIDEKARRADRVIDNVGSLSLLKPQLEALLQK
ncbi:MAG: dephospho-CoA kinase [Candidatus Melainabacteria bacterium]|nr:dephospho-CoA kinase [Candidatus Melainabacteria bacterium]